MKKTYVTPTVEKISFQYRDQVVVASGVTCTQVWNGFGDSLTENCTHTTQVKDSGY